MPTKRYCFVAALAFFTLANPLLPFWPAAQAQTWAVTAPPYLTLGATPVPLGGAAGTAGNPLTGVYLASPTVTGVLTQSSTSGAPQTNMLGTNGKWAIGLDVGNASNPKSDLYWFKCTLTGVCATGNDMMYLANNGRGLAAPVVVSGGTGFSDGCTIPLSGGTDPAGGSSVQAVLVVNTGGSSGGVIQSGGVSISGANGYGIYGAEPTGTIAQGAAASCGGTGATFTATGQDNIATLRVGEGSVPDMTYQMQVTPNASANAGMGGIRVRTANTGVNLLNLANVTYGDLFSVSGTAAGVTNATINAATGEAATLDFSINGSGSVKWYIQAFSTEIRFFNNVSSKIWLDDKSTGAITIGETNPVTISAAGVLGIVPATWTDTQTCTAGQIAVDASFVYVCTAANTVKRAALSTF